MRRTSVAVLLSVLVVLAGCSGVFGGSDESAETVTPAAVPTDEPTPTPMPELAPGVTKRGIEDPRALIAAHRSFLQNRSFTQRSSSTALAANGSAILQTTGTLRVGATGAVRYVSNRSGPYFATERGSIPTRIVAWSNDGNYFVQQTFANGTTTYSHPPGRRTGMQFALGTLPTILGALDTGNTTITDRRSENGTTLYHVNGTIDTRRQPNTSVRLLVDSRGVVREYSTVRQAPASSAVTKSITENRLVAINTTGTPERPSWVATAKNRTTPTADGQNRTVG
ncbi:hypothetical protein [Halococcus thailandensis]|uniref:Lipoprotein n=1 Tax=Halococcus thailandensis JCM 13552 TaxID=1227457 RepID=M0N5E5_9EURY|nr:hypothetical protein [Halococcus thailandensis]EMA53081.1 hypothetical protein C451_09807 [Halococcus thailandensis JCM 13552]